MNEPSSAKEIAAYIGSVFLSIGGAFGVWKLSSRTKLEVTENKSRGDWIKDVELQRDDALKREQQAVDREQRALDRERVALEKISSMNYTISVLTEKTERQDRKLNYLIHLVSRDRPDLADALRSSFGDLYEPKPKT